jgi:oligopeptide/dipeptide ABC transporter ATP-binding protein
MADRIGVMYAGRMMEEAPTLDLFERPFHPYTLGLRNAFPSIKALGRELISIPGTPPIQTAPIEGCGFAERCPFVQDPCRQARPALAHVSIAHRPRACVTPTSMPCVWKLRKSGHGAPEVSGLTKHYPIRRSLVARLLGRGGDGTIKAVEDLSFEVEAGEIMGIVGESGAASRRPATCWPSSSNPRAGGSCFAATTSVRLTAKGCVIPNRSADDFQDPFDSLSPRFRVSDLVAEAPRALAGGAAGDSGEGPRMLALVGLRPADYVERFPHQMSGGNASASALPQRYRRAEARDRRRARSMLDVSIRAGVLDLLRESRRMSFTCIYVSHDLSILTSICDRVMVMYMGQRMEIARSADIVESPQHPYTQALVAAVPVPDPLSPVADPIKTDRARPVDPAPGCRFAPRCSTPSTPVVASSLRPARSTGSLGRLPRRTHRCATERYRSAIVDTRRLDRGRDEEIATRRLGTQVRPTSEDLHRKALVIDSEGVSVPAERPPAAARIQRHSISIGRWPRDDGAQHDAGTRSDRVGRRRSARTLNSIYGYLAYLELHEKELVLIESANDILRAKKTAAGRHLRRAGIARRSRGTSPSGLTSSASGSVAYAQ